MSVSVKNNSLSVKAEADNRASLAIRFMLDGIHQEANQHTPMNHGNLRADVLKSVIGLHGEIRWTKNYAIYQERRQYAHYTTAGTGPHFARNAVILSIRNGREYFKKAGL